MEFCLVFGFRQLAFLISKVVQVLGKTVFHGIFSDIWANFVIAVEASSASSRRRQVKVTQLMVNILMTMLMMIVGIYDHDTVMKLMVMMMTMMAVSIKREWLG